MMDRLRDIHVRLLEALERIPQAKFALRVTLVALVLMILWIPVFYLSGLDSPWAQAAAVLILVLSGFPIRNNPDRKRSRR